MCVSVCRYVIEPYHEFPNLLDILFSFLKTEQPAGIRREVGHCSLSLSLIAHTHII